MTRSGAFHAFSRAAFSLVMAAVSRSRVSLRLCTSWTEALMAIVSRSCRLAGFSASPPRALLSSPPSSYLFLAFFLIFARTFYPSSPPPSPFPLPREYPFSAPGSSPLATRPKASEKGVPLPSTHRSLSRGKLPFSRPRPKKF